MKGTAAQKYQKLLNQSLAHSARHHRRAFCIMPRPMFKGHTTTYIFTVSLLITMLSFSALSCGGGGSSMTPQLTIQPASASIFTNYALGTYQAATLTAMFSDGTVPTNIQWSTSNGCVGVNTQRTQNTNTAACSFTCPGGTITATITASAGGSTATSSVTCTWTN